MVTIGTLTIKGTKPIECDGLYLGYTETTMRFKITDQGFVHDGKLFKTHDQNYLAEQIGFVNYKTSLKYKELT